MNDLSDVDLTAMGIVANELSRMAAVLLNTEIKLNAVTGEDLKPVVRVMEMKAAWLNEQLGGHTFVDPAPRPGDGDETA